MTRQIDSLLDAWLNRWESNRTHRIHLATSSGSSMAGYPGLTLVLRRPASWGGVKVGDCVGYNFYGEKTHHRIIRIEDVDGELRYFTKGDANPDDDPGYRTINDISGVDIVEFRGLGIWFHVREEIK